jgi:hypothetical protein
MENGQYRTKISNYDSIFITPIDVVVARTSFAYIWISIDCLTKVKLTGSGKASFEGDMVI